MISLLFAKTYYYMYVLAKYYFVILTANQQANDLTIEIPLQYRVLT